VWCKFAASANATNDNVDLVDYDWEHLTPPLLPKEPHRKSQDLRALAADPCGDDCFLLFGEDDMVSLETIFTHFNLIYV
jgi:hypothetical protein